MRIDTDGDLAITSKSLDQIDDYRRYHKLITVFPDRGPLRRELYPKQLVFFHAGERFKERLFMAANRVGKSEAGAYEVACHLTGEYPDWWEGRRFSEPVEVWACGTTSETTRDIVQAKLMGALTTEGTGMIPRTNIQHTQMRRNALAGAIETVWVKWGLDEKTGQHKGISRLGFKTYEQGRASFEGTAKHVIWYDEEPPLDIYTEGLYRTVTTRGIVLTTFTPLQGMSDVVKSFLEPETDAQADYKAYIQAGWKDVPHIPEPEKQALLATTPAYQIKARTEGEPSLGAGAIYPIAESEIVCAPFAIPDHWPRAYALDVGWRITAALWGAMDPGNQRIYLYDEHYQSQGEPASHAMAIKARGEWIAGVIDPAAEGRSQIDGRRAMELYRQNGLDLEAADNSVSTGISTVWQAMVSGQLKVFSTLQNFLSEFRKYHRKDDGKGTIVKSDDHLMDDLRYLLLSGRSRMKIKPVKRDPETRYVTTGRYGPGSSGWMAG